MLLNYKLSGVARAARGRLEITGGPRRRRVSGSAAPSTENHRSFVGGVVRAGRSVQGVIVPLDWTR